MPNTSPNKASMIHRRAFIIAGALIAASFSTARAAGHWPSILFVCQFGTARSPTAREVMKRHAAERGVAVDVSSRGVTPEDHLSAEVHDKLMAMGINRYAEAVQSLGAADLAAADIIVILNSLSVPIAHGDIRDWSYLPSMSEDFGNAMQDLDHRIEALLDEVSRRAG